MPEFTPSPALDELEHKIRAAAAALDPDPAFVNRLRSQLVLRSTEMQPTRHFPSRLAWRLALAVVLVLVSATLLIGPQRIVNAMRALFGYIPGIGMVSQDAPVRVLAAPLSQTRDGITVSVQQAVLDATHTVVVYQIDGLPASSRPPFDDPRAGCVELPFLRLPDGTRLDPLQGYPGRSWSSGFDERLVYAPLPAGTDGALLLLPCLQTTVPGTVPADWQFSLRFVPAPPSLPIYPVIDVPTATPAAATATVAGAQGGPTQPAFPYGISLALDKVIPMDDGYLLQASMPWTGSDLMIEPATNPAARLLDANGQPLEIVFVQPDQPYAPDTQRVYMDFHVLETTPPAPGPLTLFIDSLTVDLTTQATFTFDPGSHPQPGQTWPLDQDVDVLGRRIHIVSASAVSGDSTGYSFEMQSDSGVVGAMVDDRDHPTGGWAGGMGDSGPFSALVFYSDRQLPAGPLTITVTSITVVLAGPWQVSWTPPARAPQQATPASPASAACPVLTIERWQQALAHPAPLPAGIRGGMLAFDNWLQDGQVLPWSPAVARLDGSNPRRLAQEGYTADISPDGTRAVFLAVQDIMTVKGFTISDLVSGENTLLPGKRSGALILWSPDAKEFAYTGRAGASQCPPDCPPFDLFVMDADGTNLRQVTDTPEDEYLVAWTPDGSGLVFSVDGPDGNALRALDLQTGLVTTLVPPDPAVMGYTISPDGKRVATTERKYGNEDKLYVSALDRSQKRLLVNVAPSTVSDPVWSPDGSWLAVTITPPDAPTHILIPTIGLLQVDTCQVIALPALQGNITAWGP